LNKNEIFINGFQRRLRARVRGGSPLKSPLQIARANLEGGKRGRGRKGGRGGFC
jgi:hypothetical protein